MIVKELLLLLIGVFGLLTSPLSIPEFSDSIKEVLAVALDYITSGVALLSQYFDLNYLFMLFSLVLVVDVGVLLYKFVMWVLRKIPVLGID